MRAPRSRPLVPVIEMVDFELVQKTGNKEESLFQQSVPSIYLSVYLIHYVHPPDNILFLKRPVDPGILYMNALYALWWDPRAALHVASSLSHPLQPLSTGALAMACAKP